MEDDQNIPVTDNTVVEDNVPETDITPDNASESDAPSDGTPNAPAESTEDPKEEPEKSEAFVKATSAPTNFQFDSSNLRVADSTVTQSTPSKESSSKVAIILCILLAIIGFGFGGFEYYIHEINPSSPLAKLFSQSTSEAEPASSSSTELTDLEFENSRLRGDVNLLENLARATIVEEEDEYNPGEIVHVAKYLADLAPETALKSPEFGIAIDLPVDPASLNITYTVSTAEEKPNALSGTLEIANIATLYRYYDEPNPEYTFDYAGTCDEIIGEVGTVQPTYNYCVKFSVDAPSNLRAALSNKDNYYQL